MNYPYFNHDAPVKTDRKYIYRETLSDAPLIITVPAATERAKSHIRRTMREWPYGYRLDYAFEDRDICFYFARDFNV